MSATNRIADAIVRIARNPATLRKLSTEAALYRNDLEKRGHKIPKQPDLGHRHPVMTVGDRTVPTFVVCRGEDYLAGKLSLWSMVRTIDAGTLSEILDYSDARKSRHLPPPDFAKEVIA